LYEYPLSLLLRRAESRIGPIERNPGTTKAIGIIIVIPRKLFLQNLSAGKLLKVLTILAKSRKRRLLLEKEAKRRAERERESGATRRSIGCGSLETQRKEKRQGERDEGMEKGERQRWKQY